MSAPHGELSVRETDDGRGGAVAERVRVKPDTWLDDAQHVVLLVHGFNNSPKEARKAFGEFRRRLPRGLWRIGEVQWPGDADFGFLQWLDFLSYPTEIPDARQSAKRLAHYLASLTRTNPAMQLTLVGHSLGCRLILEMLDLFRTEAAAPAPHVRHILLMAAAVPVELTHPMKRLAQAAAQARERLVLFSPDDIVLRFAFPAGQTLARVMGYEDDIYIEAMGLNGEATSFASEPPRHAERNGHGSYWSDQRAADYLAQKLGAAVPHRLNERSLPKHETPPAYKLGARVLPEREFWE